MNTIRSYLTERKQVVVLDGIKSNTLNTKAGVPQGSRLGPLLFIIYMNDISSDIESDIIIFAEDIISIKATSPDPAITALQSNRDIGMESCIQP